MSRAAAVSLSVKHVERAGTVLARAFHAYALFTYALPGTEERARRLPAYFEPIVRFGTLYGRVHTTADLAGVAVWFQPGDITMDDARLQASGMSRMSEHVGAEAFARIMNVIAPLQALRHADAPELHWYLALLGVDPARQGQGIGSALLQPILAEADAAQTPCYLETQEERNVPFYERHGFRVLREINDLKSGVGNWTFRREPQVRA